jgi:hypothetical protein
MSKLPNGAGFVLSTLVEISTDYCIGNCKYNYHTTYDHDHDGIPFRTDVKDAPNIAI